MEARGIVGREVHGARRMPGHPLDIRRYSLGLMALIVLVIFCETVGLPLRSARCGDGIDEGPGWYRLERHRAPNRTGECVRDLGVRHRLRAGHVVDYPRWPDSVSAAAPCGYRLFDVDDVIANTVGTVLGIAIAPALAGLARPSSCGTPNEPRPVTSGRRLLGMLCDLLVVGLVGQFLVACYAIATVVVTDLDTRDIPLDGLIRFTLHSLVPAAAQLVVLLTTSATIGEHAVLLRPQTPRPPIGARVVRFIFGIGGYTLLASVDLPFAGSVAFALGVASIIAVLRTRGHRGLAYPLAGMELVDARQPIASPRSSHPSRSTDAG